MPVPALVKLIVRQSASPDYTPTETSPPPFATSPTSPNYYPTEAPPSPSVSQSSPDYSPPATKSLSNAIITHHLSSSDSPATELPTPTGFGTIGTPSSSDSSSRLTVLGLTITVIILSLWLAVFVGLFIWKLRQERRRNRTASSSASISEKQPLQGLAFESNLSTTSSTLTVKIGSDQGSLQRATSTTTRASSNASSSSRSTSSYPLATASYAFVSTRPDEISLSIGDRVRVIASFDDGWACVANSEGARGMVPCECLDIFLLDDESEVWDNYTDVMEKRRSGGSDITHQTDGTARTGYSERSSSLAFGDASDTSSVSTRSGDILWMVPRRLREV